MTFRFGLATRLAAAAAALGTFSSSAFAATGQPSDWEIGLQGAATGLAERVHQFNDFVTIIITLIVVFVMALLAIAMIRFNAKANPTPSRTTHHNLLEVAWTILPVAILVIIAIPSFRLLYAEYDMPTPYLTIKATGHQWYWSYDYEKNNPKTLKSDATDAANDNDAAFSFISRMVADKDLKPGQLRKLTVNNDMVVPVGKVVQVLVTGADVIHSFAMPAFAIKADAVPGRIQEVWFKADREGTYHGQCSELCGQDHDSMPIVIRVVSQQEYENWLAAAKKRFADAAPLRPASQKLAEASLIPSSVSAR
jgi:cytochrome c oxidase subunit 2